MTTHRLQELKDLHHHDPALVIGNGPSRLGLDLRELSTGKVSFGCNALYRDFSPDYLVVMDDKMLQEVVESDYALINDVIAPDIVGGHHSILFDGPEGLHCTGNMAIYAAAVMGCSPIRLVGFDGGSGNVYTATRNYSVESNVDQIKLWEEGLTLVLSLFPDLELSRLP